MSHLQNKNEEDLEKVRKGAPRAQVQVSEAIRQLRSEISRILQKRRVASLTQSLTISFPCFLVMVSWPGTQTLTSLLTSSTVPIDSFRDAVHAFGYITCKP